MCHHFGASVQAPAPAASTSNDAYSAASRSRRLAPQTRDSGRGTGQDQISDPAGLGAPNSRRLCSRRYRALRDRKPAARRVTTQKGIFYGPQTTPPRGRPRRGAHGSCCRHGAGRCGRAGSAAITVGVGLQTSLYDCDKACIYSPSTVAPGDSNVQGVAVDSIRLYINGSVTDTIKMTFNTEYTGTGSGPAPTRSRCWMRSAASSSPLFQYLGRPVAAAQRSRESLRSVLRQ